MNRSAGCAGGAEPPSGRGALAAFLVLYAGYAALLFVTFPQLPARVATHFGAGGEANGWMSRSGYLLFELAFPLALGLVFAGVSALVRTMPAAFVNIPRRAYWLAPERRAMTAGLIRNRMGWLACLMTLFFGGLHLLTVAANRAQPPRLPTDGFMLVLASFLVGMLAWTVLLVARFMKTDAP